MHKAHLRIRSHSLEKYQGAHDVRLNKGRGRCYRAIDMRLSCQVQNRRRAVALKDTADNGCITDVAVFEVTAIPSKHISKIGQIPCIRQRVEYNHMVASTLDHHTDEIAANKAGSTSDKYTLHRIS
jgi:hypothetical protein